MSGDKEEIMDEVKPVFHITGGKGWINDPNGLIKINDEYHVFFQYYPHATHWGPMHWGHVKSKNLTEWERLPVALYPDENDDGCFSGSAVDFCGKLYLVYTSHKDGKNGNPVREEQAIASSSDLVHTVRPISATLKFLSAAINFIAWRRQEERAATADCCCFLPPICLLGRSLPICSVKTVAVR